MRWKARSANFLRPSSSSQAKVVAHCVKRRGLSKHRKDLAFLLQETSRVWRTNLLI